MDAAKKSLVSNRQRLQSLAQQTGLGLPDDQVQAPGGKGMG